jgi:putative transposase
LSTNGKRELIDRDGLTLSLVKQCFLLDLPRSSFYYTPCLESPLNLELMRLIDELATDFPYYGSRRMTVELQDLGHAVNRKRVVRLMRTMGLEAVYPKPRLSTPGEGHKIYPYLLRNLPIQRPNHVWGTDITYIRMRHGFLYLVAIIDWFSRFVLSWRLSNSLDVIFCIAALQEALGMAVPEIFNSDQGSQFTCNEFTSILETAKVNISMDGRGRALDNVFTERFWWTLKYEEVYLYDYEDGVEAFHGIDNYIHSYNYRRKHSSLGRRTPAEVYLAKSRQLL